MTAEEVEQAAAQAGPDSSIDLSELLYDQQQAAQLISTPVEVLAFADEEGVRCGRGGGADGAELSCHMLGWGCPCRVWCRSRVVLCSKPHRQMPSLWPCIGLA